MGTGKLRDQKPAEVGAEAEGSPSGASEAGCPFQGVFEHALDEKGRVSFPSEFRQVLSACGDSAVVLTNFVSDGARCIEGYSASAWSSLESKIRLQSRFDPKVRRFENFYLARAQRCPLDSSGRIAIPLHLRHYAGLDREVVFTSSVHGFRLWDRRVWELVFQEAEAAVLEDPELFIGLDLK